MCGTKLVAIPAKQFFHTNIMDMMNLQVCTVEKEGYYLKNNLDYFYNKCIHLIMVIIMANWIASMFLMY
jgi:hypothetical protein